MNRIAPLRLTGQHFKEVPKDRLQLRQLSAINAVEIFGKDVPAVVMYGVSKANSVGFFQQVFNSHTHAIDICDVSDFPNRLLAHFSPPQTKIDFLLQA